MTFRARLTITLVAVAALPLGILGWVLRQELTARLAGESARRVAVARSTVEARVREAAGANDRRLATLAAELANDNRFRLAIGAPGSPERRWLIDWAPSTMALAGLVVLQVHDSTGRILTSGQFRNDFDRIAPAVIRVDSSAAALVLDARTPDHVSRALVSRYGFTVRGERFFLVGGTPLDSGRVAGLSGDPAVAAILSTRAAPADQDTTVAHSLPWVDEVRNTTGTATISLIADDAPVRAIGSEITRWLLVALGITVLAAVVVATMLGRVMSAPIADLAERTSRLDLDRLDQRFATGRDDEVGSLEKTLDALAGRLRASVSRLRHAERAAATGDLARQVNHDVKNGLAPIRNVLRHLAQVAERDPDKLGALFAERRSTLDASVEYLEQLARNYARLAPSSGSGRTDPHAVVVAVAGTVTAATVEVRAPHDLPPVRGDSVVLRRILENLVANAVDALEGGPGTVTIGAQLIGQGAERRVRFTVADTGRGMTRQELDRAFDDFHTTKPTGTGLGLSVVRRLVADVGGSVRAETAPGAGSSFMVDIPVAS